jgi:hypothetical protein
MYQDKAGLCGPFAFVYGFASDSPSQYAKYAVDLYEKGNGPDDIARSFKTGVAELEARAAEAEREAKRLADRLHQCAERRNALHRIVEDARRWAAQQSPPVVLPGDEPGLPPPVVVVHEPPPGTHDFLGRPT